MVEKQTWRQQRETPHDPRVETTDSQSWVLHLAVLCGATHPTNMMPTGQIRYTWKNMRLNISQQPIIHLDFARFIYTNRARAHLPLKQRLSVDILNRSDSYVLCGKSAHSQWPFAWPTQGLCLSESPLQIWLWYLWITLLYHSCFNTQHVPKFESGHFWCKNNMKSPALGSIVLKYWRQLYKLPILMLTWSHESDNQENLGVWWFWVC